jgi:hypothetical protein
MRWYEIERARTIAESFAQRQSGILPSDLLAPRHVVAIVDEAVPLHPGPGKVFVAPCRLSGYTYQLPAGLELGHLSQFFNGRDYDRTLAFVYVAVEPSPKNSLICYPVMFRGTIPRRLWDRDCTLICGINRNDVSAAEPYSCEAIALIPHDPATGEPAYEQAFVCDDPRHLSRLQQRTDSLAGSAAAEASSGPSLTESQD